MMPFDLDQHEWLDTAFETSRNVKTLTHVRSSQRELSVHPHADEPSDDRREHGSASPYHKELGVNPTR